MGYVVGIDLGTTFTAVAVARSSATGGVPTMVTLGHRAIAIPSVVFVAADGTMIVGDQAERAGAVEPSRLATEFKRRFGDSTPLVLAGRPHSPQALMAALLRSVLAQVEAEEGAPPELVMLTHPANWGPYKQELFAGVPKLAGVRVPVATMTEPEAAAGWYARQARVPDGATVAVYDLGGGTFDAALLRHQDGHFSIVGRPQGIEQLGGIDIDHALTTQLLRIVGADRSALAASTDGQQRLLRQQAACVEAKEALSSRERVDIANVMTGVPPAVPLSRAEFEALTNPLIDQTVSVLGQTIEDSGIPVEGLHAVLLVGGTSRIPLVARKVGEALGRPVTVDTHPKNAVALGAASEALAQLPELVPAGGPHAAPLGAVAPPARLGHVLADEAAPHVPTQAGHAAGGPGRVFSPGSGQHNRRRWVRLATALVAGVVVAGAVVTIAALQRDRANPRQEVSGAGDRLKMEIPSGWQLTAEGAWDKPSLGQGQPDLGPYAMQAHPGEAVVSNLDTDRRPFVFLGVPTDDHASSLAGLLQLQADHWNPKNGRCTDLDEPRRDELRDIERHWTGCLQSDDFLERAWRMADGTAVYAHVRLGNGLSETEARTILGSVRLAPA